MNALDRYRVRVLEVGHGLSAVDNVLATTWDAGDSWVVALPHAFPFAGRVYDSVRVYANGYLHLNHLDPGWDLGEGLIENESDMLYVADGAVVIAPWWQPLKSLPAGSQIGWSWSEGEGFIYFEWRGIHVDDNDVVYKERRFGVRLYWAATSGHHDVPGAVYLLYLPEADLDVGGSPSDPDDAAIGFKNQDAFRAPHDEADASDATYPLGGHIDADGKTDLRISTGWGATLAAGAPSGWYMLEPSPDEVLRAWPKGTHLVGVASTIGWDVGMGPTDWWMAFYDLPGGDDDPELGEPPAIVSVTDEGGGVVTLGLDAALVPGVKYWLYPPTIAGVQLSAGLLVTGARRDLVRQESPDKGALLDIDAPVLPRNDGRVPQFTVKGGDYILTGGVETITKAIWSAILEQRGERYWDPQHGGLLDFQGEMPTTKELREEEERLAKQIEALPFVDEAVVQFIYERDHLVLVWRARTAAGVVTDRRAIDAAQ